MSDDPLAGQPAPPDGPPPSSSPPPPPAATSVANGGTGAVATPKRSRTGGGIDINPVLAIGVAAVVLLVLSLFLEEDGARLWSDLGVLWSLFALAMVLLTLLPSVRKLVNLSERQAWQIAAIAAGALVFWWVLFVLPVINRNVSFLATLAVAAAGVGVWLSPGNTLKDTADTPTAAP